MTNKKYVAAIDQGTTSTRCIIFNHDGEQVAVGQLEHEQIFPEKGWVEHDPEEIWSNTRRAVGEALANGDITVEDIDSVGITNQRETTVVWDKHTGKPVYNAIVWQDTRTTAICKELSGEEGPEKWRRRTGLFINSYPAGPKVKWILDNVEGARERAEAGDLLFGTIDSWLLWNLTGGAEGDAGREALHATDVTNASRTLLMDIEKLEWDEELCKEMGIPMSMLPEIRPSLGDFRTVRERGSLSGVPIRAILGDQQSAMFGQGCFRAGSAKNTYGTGLFLLLNTGTTPKFSENGLLTTVCFQREGERPVYALEGSVSMGGSLVQWLRDNLQIIPNAASIENLAREVKDNGGVYIVPAFSGLFAPVLAPGCSWRHRGSNPLCQPQAPGPRRARVHCISDPRRGRCDGGRLRCGDHRAARGRRHDHERTSDAVPSGHARRGGTPSEEYRDHRDRRGLRGRFGQWLLG